MKDFQAASRYAQSLYELAREQKIDVELEAALETLPASIQASPAIDQFFQNPRVTLAEKKKALAPLKSSGKAETLLADFLLVLLAKQRFDLLPEIAIAYKRISDLGQNEAVVEIRAAAALDAEGEKRIVSRFEQVSGLKLVPRTRIEPSLVGGIVVKIRNRVWDGSVKGNVDRLKRQLKAKSAL